VSLFWGEADPAVPPSGAEFLPEFYSNYTLEIIEECGHFGMIEKPELLVDRIKRSFLQMT
jgi:pimeloyl-ACP methyl ester carboxylesterase